jgi:hypothetical protein
MVQSLFEYQSFLKRLNSELDKETKIAEYYIMNVVSNHRIPGNLLGGIILNTFNRLSKNASDSQFEIAAIMSVEYPI